MAYDALMKIIEKVNIFSETISQPRHRPQRSADSSISLIHGGRQSKSSSIQGPVEGNIRHRSSGARPCVAVSKLTSKSSHRAARRRQASSTKKRNVSSSTNHPRSAWSYAFGPQKNAARINKAGDETASRACHIAHLDETATWACASTI